MLKLNARAFFEAVSKLDRLLGLIRFTQANRALVMDENQRTTFRQAIKELAESIKPLGVRISEMAVADTLTALDATPPINVGTFENLLGNIGQTLERELSLTNVFVIDAEKAKYFESSQPLFGPEVATKFPSISYDIEEAGKCYALRRSTASAFHSIRCLEAGIRALCRCLGIPDPTKGSERNWSNILRKLNEELDRRWQKSGRLSGDGQLFEEVIGALGAIQNPYRNATMHLDDRKYTEDEARHIFEMVRGFMKKVASRMDEDGKPKV